MRLTPEIWDSMNPIQQRVYSERNDRLWELVRAVMPEASGELDIWFQRALGAASVLRASLPRGETK